eukprot:581338-Hanusia_phi.AAC.4
MTSIQDTFQHRPIDRLSCACFDYHTKELITFGNRAKFWKIESKTNFESQSLAMSKNSSLQPAIRSRLGKTEKSRAKTFTNYQLHNDELMKESGWTVVDVSKVVDELQEEYKRGDLQYLPSLDILSSRNTMMQQSEVYAASSLHLRLFAIFKDQRMQDKLWVLLQSQLDDARKKGTGEQTVAACYSNVFHQIILVGVHHVRTFWKCQELEFQLGSHAKRILEDEKRNRIVDISLPEQVHRNLRLIMLPTCIRFIQRPLVGAGWDQAIVMYPDGKDDNAQSVNIQVMHA